ncbi:MAG: DUF2235 domain-containing protein [Tateyamaria sp.]|uniref:DUF2235 domain-containing protein n=1 Tax=Tateyamaria sp. TaxID=1929288 RepID=UPI0032872520
MIRSRLNKLVKGWLNNRFGRGEAQIATPVRGSTNHVIVIDGTMSTLDPGDETNAGLLAKLLGEMGSEVSLYYEPGLQWSHWHKTGDVIFGRGINSQIQRAYGYLASRYRPGDKIFLFGYSRGAYAVRSLAGIIDRVGLLRADAATERNIRDVYRYYECAPDSDGARIFNRNNCHAETEIELIGAWDTVKSLGLNMPYFWRWSAPRHAFHNHHLSKSVKRGFHALAMDETRVAYAPVMWEATEDWKGHLEQVWFRGTHGDIGGHLTGFSKGRPLANIPLVWMLERAESCGLPLSEGWAAQFPQDATVPSVGTFRGLGRWFITRKARIVGRDPSEQLHISISDCPPRPNWAKRFLARRGRGADAL